MLLGSDSDIIDDEDEPVLDTVNVIHDGAVNRLRVRGPNILCTWNSIPNCMWPTEQKLNQFALWSREKLMQLLASLHAAKFSAMCGDYYWKQRRLDTI